jgi:phenylpyruvate tautomerase PptA (4-oxalocrotonate tautomerase family)
MPAVQIAVIKQRATTESKTALADEYGVSSATLNSVMKAA